MKNIFASFRGDDLAVDLGSATSRIIVVGRGLIVDEPSVLVRRRQRLRPGPVVAFGRQAAQMAGRQPEGLEMVWPIRRGVVVDFEAAFRLFDHFLEMVRALPHRFPQFLGPRLLVGIPTAATEVERRAIQALWRQLRARSVALVNQALLAALGGGLAIEENNGGFLVDLGAAKTEIAVISLGGVVVGRSLNRGGDDADRLLLNFLRLKYSLLIGQPTARWLKEKIGSLVPQKEEASLVVRGRDLETGLPKSVRLRAVEVREALAPLAQEIIGAIKEVLEEAPPELTPNFLEEGIFLSGGFSQLPGWPEAISRELRLPVWRLKEPALATVRGAAKLLQQPRLLSRLKLVAGLD